MAEDSKQETKLILFISKDSMYFQVTMEEFQKLLHAFDDMQPFESEIVDVTESPDKAEQYKVNALPTLIVGDKRFIGKPNAKEIIQVLQPEALKDDKTT